MPQHLQIQLNPKQNPRIIGSILSKKNVSVKDQSVFIGDIRVSFFDLCPCRRLGTQRQHGINYISDNKVVHPPAAMDKNLNTDITDEHGFDFFTDFFLSLYSLDLFLDFRGFASINAPFFWIISYLCQKCILNSKQICYATIRRPYIPNKKSDIQCLQLLGTRTFRDYIWKVIDDRTWNYVTESRMSETHPCSIQRKGDRMWLQIGFVGRRQGDNWIEGGWKPKAHP